MRALFPVLIAFPVLIFARPVWACDHDDDNDSDDEDVAEVESPETPEPPEPPDAPEHWVASVFNTPEVDIDIRWDIDVRWNDHGDDERAAASDLVRDQIQNLQRELEDATRELEQVEQD
ncbi:MAG: hypothetical protein ABI591_12260 [Kofleriaceae bacterium]